MRFIYLFVITLVFVSCRRDEIIIVSTTNKVDNIFLSGKASVYPTKAIIAIDEKFSINSENFSDNVKYKIVNGCIVFIVKLVESRGTELYFSDIKFDNNQFLITLCNRNNEGIQGSNPRFFVATIKTNVKFNNSMKIKMLDCEK